MLNVQKRLRGFAAEFSERIDLEPSEEHEKAFLGTNTFGPTNLSKQRLENVFRLASFHYQDEEADAFLIPSPKARHRTQEAAKRFFKNAHLLLKDTDLNSPLYDANKCIGFVALPKSKLVIIALSQDRVPQNDTLIRESMINLIEQVNAMDPLKVYKLALVPTKEEYFVYRALSVPTPYDGEISDEILIRPRYIREYSKMSKSTDSAFSFKPVFTDLSKSSSGSYSSCVASCQESYLRHGLPRALIDYRTRCVEVALMSALNKIGRTLKIAPEEVSMEAFGGGLWCHPVTQDDIAVHHSYENKIKPRKEQHLEADIFQVGFEKFKAKMRSAKYTVEPSLEIRLEEHSTAYLDYWGPCDVHCQQMIKDMRAVSISGGASSSFGGSIFEPEIHPKAKGVKII